MQTRPVIPKDESVDNPPTGGGGFKLPGNTLVYVAAVALISLIISIGVNYFLGVSKSEVNKFITDTQSQVDAMSADLRESMGSVKNALDALPTTIDTRVNSSISSLLSRLSTMEVDISALENNVVKLNNELPDLNRISDDINSLFTQISTIKSDIASLKTSVGSLATTSKLDELTKNYTALKTALDELQKKFDALTGGSTGGGGTTPTTTGLSASIVGTNPMPLIGGTNTINIILTNTTSKAIYAEQISIQLQFLTPPTAINTWGLTLTSMSGTFGTPSYSIISGTVTYLMSVSAYIEPGKSQTISIVITAGTPPPTINFVTTVVVVGYNSLP